MELNINRSARASFYTNAQPSSSNDGAPVESDLSSINVSSIDNPIQTPVNISSKQLTKYRNQFFNINIGIRRLVEGNDLSPLLGDRLRAISNDMFSSLTSGAITEERLDWLNNDLQQFEFFIEERFSTFQGGHFRSTPEIIYNSPLRETLGEFKLQKENSRMINWVNNLQNQRAFSPEVALKLKTAFNDITAKGLQLVRQTSPLFDDDIADQFRNYWLEFDAVYQQVFIELVATGLPTPVTYENLDQARFEADEADRALEAAPSDSMKARVAYDKQIYFKAVLQSTVLPFEIKTENFSVAVNQLIAAKTEEKRLQNRLEELKNPADGIEPYAEVRSVQRELEVAQRKGEQGRDAVVAILHALQSPTWSIFGSKAAVNIADSVEPSSNASANTAKHSAASSLDIAAEVDLHRSQPLASAMLAM